MSVQIDENVIDFLTGIHGDLKKTTDRKSKILIRTFENAYRDMSTHTVVYIPSAKTNYFDGTSKRVEGNKAALKQSLMDYFYGYRKWSDLPGITSPTDFDKWHKDFCDYIVGISVPVNLVNTYQMTVKISLSSVISHSGSGIFTYGQAQKLLNMALKYLYIYTQCEDGIAGSIHSSIASVSNYFHVPLDSYVLLAVGNILVNSPTIKVSGTFEDGKYNGFPWSKIDNYTVYKQCQDDIVIAIGKITPFVWELSEWPFNIAGSALSISPSVSSGIL